MPPAVDLVAACAGVSCDKKIACETLANAYANTTTNTNTNTNPNQEHDQPDFPPESFWLSKDAEFDWFDRNAFYERQESHKGHSNHACFNPNPNPSQSFNSQRFSSTALKAKALIFGLPTPQQKFDPKSKRYCKTTTKYGFPKRNGSVGKPDAPLCEPSSPKVSCMGRVRSTRDRGRLKNRQGSCLESGSLRSKPDSKPKPGLFSSIMTIFRSRKGSGTKTRDRRKESSERKRGVVYSHDIMDRLPRGEAHAQSKRVESPPRKSLASEPRRSVDGEPFGLGGMKRFTSGRRSDSWIGDVA